MPRFLFNIQTTVEIEASNENEAREILEGEGIAGAAIEGGYDFGLQWPSAEDVRTVDHRLIDRDVLLVEVDGQTPA